MQAERFLDSSDDKEEMLKIKMNITLCALKLDTPDPEKALKYSEEVLEMDPDNSRALYRRGLVSHF